MEVLDDWKSVSHDFKAHAAYMHSGLHDAMQPVPLPLMVMSAANMAAPLLSTLRLGLCTCCMQQCSGFAHTQDRTPTHLLRLAELLRRAVLLLEAIVLLLCPVILLRCVLGHGLRLRRLHSMRCISSASAVHCAHVSKRNSSAKVYFLRRGTSKGAGRCLQWGSHPKDLLNLGQGVDVRNEGAVCLGQPHSRTISLVPAMAAAV